MEQATARTKSVWNSSVCHHPRLQPNATIEACAQVPSTASQPIRLDNARDESSKLYDSYFTTKRLRTPTTVAVREVLAAIIGVSLIKTNRLVRGSAGLPARIFGSVVSTSIAQLPPMPSSLLPRFALPRFALPWFALPHQPRVPSDHVFSLGLTIVFSLARLILKMYSRAENTRFKWNQDDRDIGDVHCDSHESSIQSVQPMKFRNCCCEGHVICSRCRNGWAVGAPCAWETSMPLSHFKPGSPETRILRLLRQGLGPSPRRSLLAVTSTHFLRKHLLVNTIATSSNWHRRLPTP